MKTAFGTGFESAFRHSKKSIFVNSVLPAKSRQEMIAEAAYHLAEKRGFMPGYEQQDWFEAELVIRAQFPPGTGGNHEM